MLGGGRSERAGMKCKELIIWTALHWESARSLDSVFVSVLSRTGGGIMIKRRPNAPLIRLWMRVARCSSSFMLCRFHRGDEHKTLSQHPAQPHQTPLHCKHCGLPHFMSVNSLKPAGNYGCQGGQTKHTLWWLYWTWVWHSCLTCEGWEIIISFFFFFFTIFVRNWLIRSIMSCDTKQIYLENVWILKYVGLICRYWLPFAKL